MQSAPSVHPSVRQREFPLYLLKRVTLDLDLLHTHYHSTRSKVKSRSVQLPVRAILVSETLTGNFMLNGCLGSVMVRAYDLRLIGREFDPRPWRYRV